MTSEVIRPKCCGECARYLRNPDEEHRGWCDEWGGVELHDDWVCNPNVGYKKEVRDE